MTRQCGCGHPRADHVDPNDGRLSVCFAEVWNGEDHGACSCEKWRPNECGQFRRHAYIVANVSQVLQLGAPEYHVCIRCRKPKPHQPGERAA